MEPRINSATERRDLRRSIRNGLGTSREDAPSAVQAMRAASEMARLVELATGGRFNLAVIDTTRGTFVEPRDAIALARGTE